MLLRILAAVTGLFELLVPRQFVDWWMGVATDDDGDLKPWVYTVARIEGAVLLLWAVTRGRRSK